MVMENEGRPAKFMLCHASLMQGFMSSVVYFQEYSLFGERIFMANGQGRRNYFVQAVLHPAVWEKGDAEIKLRRFLMLKDAV